MPAVARATHPWMYFLLSFLNLVVEMLYCVTCYLFRGLALLAVARAMHPWIYLFLSFLNLVVEMLYCVTYHLFRGPASLAVVGAMHPLRYLYLILCPRVRPRVDHPVRVSARVWRPVVELPLVRVKPQLPIRMEMGLVEVNLQGGGASRAGTPWRCTSRTSPLGMRRRRPSWTSRVATFR